MTAVNRVQDEWLLSYAAGSLTHGRSLMVASQLAYREDMRGTVADAEALGGVLLDSVDRSEVSDDVLDRVLSRLDEAVPEVSRVADAAASAAASSKGVLPKPLADFVGTDLDSLKWRFMGPGMSNARLWNGPNDERLWLLRARGGIVVPEHGHTGDEWTLVLKGSYGAADGRFGVGDMDVSDDSVVHQPAIDADEECICLVMTAGPLRMKSLAARLVQPFIGL